MHDYMSTIVNRGLKKLRYFLHINLMIKSLALKNSLNLNDFNEP